MSATLAHDASSIPTESGGATTIATRIRDRARSTPDVVALREKDFGIWQEISWSGYWEHSTEVAHALLALGVEVGDRVALHSENRREWLYSDIAAVSVRAATVGLYPTNPTAEVKHMIADSGAKVLIAEDQEQVDKALEVIDDCPDLEWIVYVEPRGIRGKYQHAKLLYWNDFLAGGAQHRAANPDAVERRMAEATTDDLITLIYTSGTTGPPKGVMLSVGNVEFCIDVLINGGGFADPPPGPQDSVLSYLPLCHVAERIYSVWFSAASGITVNFAESIDTVPQNLAEVQPTILFGVPRIWEKLAAGVTIRMNSASRLKKAAFGVAMKLADGVGRDLVANGGVPTTSTRIRYAIAWLIALRPLKKRVGLSKVRYAASGAAPIAPEVLQFFMGIGVPMHEVYGMSENSAVASANRYGRVKLGTVGEPHPGIGLRIDPETGEIQTKHPAVFVGYWGLPEKTQETFTEDGWLKTGDVGVMVDGTHLKITDRMKDIIITAGGKNISPSEIENSLKASPFIKEAVVIGDKRKYLTALVGIELDTVGDWAQRRKMPFTTYRDLSEKPEVIELIQGIVRQTNEKFSRVEEVKKFRMMTKELDHEDGELTATQKVKRSSIERLFEDLIESMYAGKPAGAGAEA
jgi:long-chain acyl-CoA synthetase